jgi:RNA polymerase sigma factor (sigma-70 family)
MADNIRNSILHSLRRFFAREKDALTDGELLRRFVRQRDEAAFELLVWRHAELVLNVCRGVLREEASVEDAFQATFLVLLRKAGSIAKREALPAWLHRVAYRIALRARGQAAREARRQAGADLELLAAPAEPGLDSDLREMLHQEIARLPARYRAVVVCCCLEGRTHEETARQLGWTKGTVSGRLARARDILRKRLGRRGVTAGASVFCVELLAGSASGWTGRVPGLLSAVRGLARGGATLAGGMSPRAVALAEGVIRSMFQMKLKWGLFAFFAVCLTGLGAGLGAARLSDKKADADVSARGANEDRKPAAGEKPAERAPNEPQEVVNRLLVRRNLRTIVNGVLHYNDTFGHLPLPAITGKDGKPLLSWRVAILPFIEQDNLYRQFKLDEPWDSPHNKKLLAQMPRVFAPIGAKPRTAHSTFYQYVVGSEAVFTQWSAPKAPGGGAGPRPGASGGPGPNPSGAGSGPGPAAGAGAPEGAGIGTGGPGGATTIPGAGPAGAPRIPASIPDGTSNTLLIVEAGRAVPWTKPEDVSYHPKKPVPRLGGAFKNIFHAAFADGSVTALPRKIDEKTLRALITPAGGEVVDVNKDPLIAGSSGIRKQAIDRLRARNAALKEETGVLREVLAELKAEVRDLRWAVEEERLLKLDPDAAALQKENAQLEKTLRETRAEAAKLLAEIQQLRKDLQKRGKK